MVGGEFLLGMPPAAFLRDYWQKRPLLIRGAFPGFEAPIMPNDLAGVACEPGALARLVTHERKRDRWRVRSGPFDASIFAKLPKRDWTLLVQDCDKWFAEVGALLARFDFLPAWRLDDIMVSYATDGGSVGAHVDQYDVFLLQALGRRRWQISTDVDAPKAFRAGVELKLLREFAPTDDFVLEPGDMLYLPPGVPHHGVSIGECMTFSVGLRAPSAAEALLDFAEYIEQAHGDEPRYADPDLALPPDPSAIDARAIERIGELLRGCASDATALREWFPRFITRYRAAVAAAPRRRKLTSDEIARRLARGGELWRFPWSRAATLHATLFLGGEAFACSTRLARLLAGSGPLVEAQLQGLTAAELTTLAAVVNAGHWTIADG